MEDIMCVGLSARVEDIKDGMALVNAMGARREISVELITNLKVGDYVMIHAGMAIARITADEAQETQAILEEIYGGLWNAHS
jgi:hydrogenase expression/formation protein HypC